MSAIEPYFGEVFDLGTNVTEIKQDQYYQNTHELPDAYIGRNKFLMSTLDYLITKEGRDFLTDVILPFEHTDNTNVAWEVFHFDRSLADVEPEQGVPRYVTMKQDVHSDRLVRRGLAFMIEHGFYTTDIGRRHYMMNIQQIVDAVAETTALQALFALIQTKDFYSSCGDQPQQRLRFLTEQMRRFGIIQRGNHGMHILDSDLKDNMLRYNVRPTAYIMPPRSTSYINMRDPYMTEYSRGGRGAEALAGPDQQLTFRGTRVYEARYFETDYVAQPYDPLSQVITYGEYYIDQSALSPVPLATAAGPSFAVGCWIFDMKTDQFVNIAKQCAQDDLTGKSRLVGTLGGQTGAEASFEYTPKEQDRSQAEQKKIREGPKTLLGSTIGPGPASSLYEFRRFKAGLGVTDMATFESKFLPTIDASHHAAVMEHIQSLPSGSVIRPKYVTDFVKTLA